MLKRGLRYNVSIVLAVVMLLSIFAPALRASALDISETSSQPSTSDELVLDEIQLGFEAEGENECTLKSNNIATNMVNADAETSMYYEEKALGSIEYQNLIEQLNDDDTFFVNPLERYTVEYENFAIVYVQIDGGLTEASYFSVVFDKLSEEIMQTVAIMSRLNADENIVSKMFSDGQIIFDAILTPDGEIVEGFVLSTDGQLYDLQDLELQGFWSCLNNCLASQGIAAWVLALVAAACAAICVGSAGTACYLCIAATGIIPVGVISYCFSACS